MNSKHSEPFRILILEIQNFPFILGYGGWRVRPFFNLRAGLSSSKSNKVFFFNGGNDF